MLRRVRPFASLRRSGFPGWYALAVVTATALGPALAGPDGGLDLRITNEDLPSNRQETTGFVATTAEEQPPIFGWSRGIREDEVLKARKPYRWQTGQPVYRGDELRPKTPGLDLFRKD